MRSLCLVFVLLFFALFAPPAAARSGPVAQCTAQTSLGTSYEEASSGKTPKKCGADRWTISGPKSWLFFDQDYLVAGDEPQQLLTDIARHEGIEIFVRDENGTVASRQWSFDEASSDWRAGSLSVLNIPQVSGKPLEIAVAFHKPWSSSLLTQASLVSEESAVAGHMTTLIIACLFIGLAIAPLIYNLSYFRILRERYLLWHMLLASCYIIYVACSSGVALFILPQGAHSQLITIDLISFSFGNVAAAMFIASFIEQDMLGRRMRRGLQIGALWAVLVCFGTMIFGDAIRPYAKSLYFNSFAPLLLLYVAALFQALSRGSRAAKFVAIGLLPMFLVGLERLLRGAALYTASPMMDQLILPAMAIEIIITAIGVADRFLMIRQQRDEAQIKARLLQDVAESDPLTDLLNRRGIERYFNKRRHHIKALAVLDLDHFKLVNDLHGHDVGDRVLLATAQALSSSSATMVGRIGGEEFVLLLSAYNAHQESERLRTAVTRQVATDVQGLDGPVTASCGLYHIEPADMELDFGEICAQADKLLYKAKRAGRNRLSFNDAPVRQVKLPLADAVRSMKAG